MAIAKSEPWRAIGRHLVAVAEQLIKNQKEASAWIDNWQSQAVLAEAPRRVNDWVVPNETRPALALRGKLDVPGRSTEIPEDQAAHFARQIAGPLDKV